MTSTPIEDHGIIGDLRTAALIDKQGTIDFLCAPDFDSPTVFCSLLDPDAGHFSLAPAGQECRTQQLYLPDTAILLTRFMSNDGIAELSDFMPTPDQGGLPRVIRRVRVVRGQFAFAMRCAPRFDYARGTHSVEPHEGERAGLFRPDDPDKPALMLRASVPLAVDGQDMTASFTLCAGESAFFIMEKGVGAEEALAKLDPEDVAATFKATATWWHDWVGRSTYTGRWREVVARSAMTLKLLTSARHGAMVAAVTFGLPEKVGGDYNWDYRYCWIRDASFTMYAFMRLGLVGEAEQFRSWIGDRVRDCKDGEEPLRIMYAIDGTSGDRMEEAKLDFAGWCGSRPVLIGNGAAAQMQLDIFGELMDSVYLANKYGRASTYDEWRDVCRVIDWVCANWRKPDHGIWEERGEKKHYLHSRLMCWVAIDRAIRLAERRSFPAPFGDWNETRNEIHASIHEEFWNADLGRFVNVPGTEVVDGSMLLMPLVRFISPRDPRWTATLAAIGEILVEDALVYRFLPPEEDVWGNKGSAREGSFLACSFWYVEALARSGDVPQARLLFDKLLGYGNHLGLFAEELSPNGRQLGNFPQALTHLALISAASYLDRALSGKGEVAWS